MESKILEFIADHACGEPNKLKVVRHTGDEEDGWDDDEVIEKVRTHLIIHEKRYVYSFFPSTIVVMPRSFAETALSYCLRAATMYPCPSAMKDLSTMIAASEAKTRNSAIGWFRHLCCLATKLTRCYVWNVVHGQAVSKIWCVYESGVRLLWSKFTVEEHGQMLVAMLCFLGVPALVTESRATPKVPAIVMRFGVEYADIKKGVLELIKLAENKK